MDEIEGQFSEKQFWNGAKIFIKNLPSVHKKLCAAIDIHSFYISNGVLKLNRNFLKECVKYENFKHKFSENDIELIACDVSDNRAIDLESNSTSFQGVLFVKKLLLKSLKSDVIYCLQIINFLEKKITQFCLSDDFKEMFSYEIVFDADNVSVTPFYQNGHSENWCMNVLKPKFVKWMNSSYSNKKSTITSNTLIDPEQFVLLYKSLKQKYGDELVKSWTESTDPKKFVYEDIGIATYLILLWKEMNHDFKGFLDLGCGNGLLVYLLNSEGYSGYGIDIKKRKIWNTYPSSTKLVEQTIDPSAFNLKNDAIDYQIDWIIGNHSDELSAWIPIISALSSYEAKYFLLPCCAYELSGEKFQRRNSKLSIYNDFLKYVENLSSNLCDFITISDRLKIPSTKRIAFIGMKRNYEADQFHTKCTKLKQNILEQLQENKIKLRSGEQSVRNCTQIDKKIVDEIVLKLFKILLKTENNGGNWNEGTTLEILDLINNLNENELKILKSECGGLKTLLKNKHEIFNVNGNSISIRRPQIKENFSKEKMTYKKRKCFFFYNHPNGCPLENDECTFIHDESF